MEKMVDWATKNVPVNPAPSVLEVGSGNGVLLFALHEAGYPAENMCGVDYSDDAVKLARAVGQARPGKAKDVTFDVCDFLHEFPPYLGSAVRPTGDNNAMWDFVLDKGTFDAISLADKDADGNPPATAYPPRIGAVVKPGGFFLIVCTSVQCIFPSEE